MDKRISDLFDYGEEPVVTDENNNMFDPEEIKKLTMKKIHKDLSTETTVQRRKYSRTFLAVAIAACLIFSFAIAAYAIYSLGICDLLPNSAKNLELPETAANLVEQHNETVAADGWSARVTESICDEYNILVTVTVTANEKYILAFDGTPEDPVSIIGLDGNQTLAEYAAAQGKTILFVGAALDLPKNIGDISGGTSSQNITENELVLLLRIEKRVSTPSIDVVCRVWATEYGSKEASPVAQIPITLTELQSEYFEYVPTAVDAVPNLQIGNARVAVSPLGINMVFPVYTDNLSTIYGFSYATCDEVSGTQGYFKWYDDGLAEAVAPSPADIEDITNASTSDGGVWKVEWLMGQGTASDRLTVHFFGKNNEPMGVIVFIKQ